MHEAIEEFLFQLKRRNGEGATSFSSSRFRTQLDRVQTLIAQERELVRKKRTKKDSGKDSASSSLEETDMSDGAGSYGTARGPAPSADAEPQVHAKTPPETGDEGEPPTAGAAAAEPQEEGRAKSEKARSERSASHAPSSHRDSHGKKKRLGSTLSQGTFEEDHAKSLRKMQRMLGTLEPGKLKPTPIFPQSVLGPPSCATAAPQRSRERLSESAAGGVPRNLRTQQYNNQPAPSSSFRVKYITGGSFTLDPGLREPSMRIQINPSYPN